MCTQVRDVGSGAFGVCKLMKNTETDEMVAVKLMERGDKARNGLPGQRRMSCIRRIPSI